MVRGPRARRGVVLGLGLYLLGLLSAPVLHHDVACHVQSRIHCSACTASPTAASTPSPAGWAVTVLPLAGHLLSPAPLAVSPPDAPASIGRSPPA